MKALLTEITISSAEFNEAELELFRKYYPQVKYKEVSDFEPYDSSLSKEEKIKIAEEKFSEYNKKDRKAIGGYSATFVCDLHLFMHDFPHQKFQVNGTREIVVEPSNVDALKLHQHAMDEMLKAQEIRLNSMMNTFIKMSQDITKNLSVDTLNQKCDVHIGGGLLMTVNETLLMEDACTDELQTQLNSGWRILAVNVQNDCRRPDYVLGRYNPELVVDGSAKRS
jgi:hypothetical protein